MRKYLAIYDNGHDSGEFEYYSESRNNSKKNMEDAKKKMKSNYGNSSRNYEIIQTHLQ